MSSSIDHTGSVAEALRGILARNPKVHILDYQTVFVELWQAGLELESLRIGGQTIAFQDAETDLIIVGITPPDQENRKKCLKDINVSDHLTSLSWTAAWRLKFPSAQARIVVMDSEGDHCSGSSANSLAMLLSARNGDGSNMVPGLAFLDRPSLAAVMELLYRPKQAHASRAITTVLLRNTIWEGLTANRENHHAISNVLGAFLLGMQPRDVTQRPEQDPIQDCLFGLLQALTGGKKTDPHGAWISSDQKTAIQGAVIIDDMADIWDSFLRSAMGFEGDQGRRLVTSPKGGFLETISGLPQRLSHFLSSGAVRLDARTLIPGDHALGENFVLFLDLRLFPRSADANPFFRAISVFGLKLLDSGRNLPWLDGDNANRKSLLNELEYWDGTKTSTPPPTLPAPETLLPRLLSLVDPTLPIIIFSSTHRTELIDPFRDYSNIITKFRKPILNGMTRDWSEVVKELHDDFVSAMEQATRIQNTRKLFQTLA